jgi:hypothetical protein
MALRQNNVYCTSAWWKMGVRMLSPPSALTLTRQYVIAVNEIIKNNAQVRK